MEVALDRLTEKFTVESNYYDLLSTKDKVNRRFQTVRAVQRIVETVGPFAHIEEE